jgi:hypothetical protein
MEELVNWNYRAFKDDPDVKFLYDQGTVEIETINSQWKDYAFVSLDYSPFYRGHGWENDLFYFGYEFSRPFTREDYEILKKKHSKIIIGVRFTNVGTEGRKKHWNSNTSDDIYQGDYINLDSVSKLPLRAELDSEKTLLGKIPAFLFQTNCLFFLVEDWEIIDAFLHYQILHNVYDLCAKKEIDPRRFFICDNSLVEKDFIHEKYHVYFKHRFRPKKPQVKRLGFPRFEAMTAIHYSGNDGAKRFTAPELNLTIQRKKKFLFLNRRARYHRTAMILRLDENNLLDNFYFGWGDKDGYYDPHFGQLMPHKDWRQHRRQQKAAGLNPNYSKHPFFEKAPYRLDCDLNLEEKDPPHFGPRCDNKGIYSFVQDSYISLVSETDISPHYAFLTEKTFKRFAWKHPFLIWGNPYSLGHLRDLGYRTFSPWLNERYDTIQDPKKRFDVLFAEIERLSSMSLEDIHKMYLEMIPVLEHNFQHFNHSSVLERSFNRMLEKI